MKVYGEKFPSLLALMILVGCLTFAFNNSLRSKADQSNTLSPKEKVEGWKLLFDGKTVKEWRGANMDSFPKNGWIIEGGNLTVLGSSEGESKGGDIVTINEYSDFEFVADFKLTPVANSGIKYFVVENKLEGSALGLEFQLLDDDKHPDAKMGKNGNRTIGSLYDLIPAKNKKVNPIGQWNTAKIIVRGNHIEHWLNEVKVVEYYRGDEDFRAKVAESKFADPKYNQNGRFGESPKGHILLQDHRDKVSYRNIKIRILSSSNKEKHPKN